MSNEHTEHTQRGIDLQILFFDLLQEARKLLWLGILLVIACSAVLCFRIYRTYTPQYKASASFTVNVVNPLQSGIRTYNSATAEQMAKTFPYILTSGALYDLISQELELPVLPAITASVLPNTNIFSLTVQSGDPQLAYDVLNAVIIHYPRVAEFVVGPTEMNLLDESGVPENPFNTRNYRSGIKQGVVIGVVLWIGILLLFAVRRVTVHNEEELKGILNLRCMSQLPNAHGYRRNAKNGTCPLVTEENDKFGFGESVRLLRIRSEKEMRDRNMKILLVSSAIAGEGKTTVSINLALALAQKGNRTLLVDCDLRNPSIGTIFGRENTPGMAAYLKGRVSGSEMIQSLDEPNLYAVCGGKPVRNAAELLARRETRAFMDQVKEAFDYVILDTPPCSLMADAAELAELADGAILVIRQNYASRDQIMEGAQLLADSRLPLIGCVLNGVDRRAFGKSYSDYYGYGSYYAYGGYGEKNKHIK